MKPLRIALVSRDSPRSGESRMIGEFSYSVPEFEWTMIAAPRRFTMDKKELAERGAQIIVHEDAKAWGDFTGDVPLPVAYIVRDSTLSEDHFMQRFWQAQKAADLVLVDWDDLARFEATGKPVRRLSHCVNDQLFRDYGEGKSVDAAFHAACKGSPERSELWYWLGAFCEAHGYSFARGVMVGHEYPKALARAKVVINLERTPTTRAHRLFDAMACRCCVLTTPEPEVSGEHNEAGVHYAVWRDYDELEAQLARLLAGGEWERYANAGYELVKAEHTWAVRAPQLRATLAEVLGV